MDAQDQKEVDKTEPLNITKRTTKEELSEMIDEEMIDLNVTAIIMEKSLMGEFDNLSDLELLQITKEIYMHELELNDPNWQKKK